MNNKVLGVLGGLGPMATVYFFNMIVSLTDAEKDQDHLDILISNRSTTYDRTAYILGESENNPIDMMIADGKRLESIGAECIAIPCNTAHYFYDEIQNNLNVPVLNIIEETVSFISNNNYKKAGILATSGTITTHTYQKMCDKYNLSYEIPDKQYQEDLMDIIYEDIKSGKPANMSKFSNIINHMIEKDCDCVILGCTELSILKNDNKLNSEFYIDSMELLAKKAIVFCGKNIKGV